MKKIIYLSFVVILSFLFFTNVYATAGNSNSRTYPSSIKIINSPKSINVGEKYQLKTNIDSSDATENKLTWTTSDSTIVTVDKNGLLVGKKKGTVKITVTTSNGKSESIAVTVKNESNSSESNSLIVSNKVSEMLVGDKAQLKVDLNFNSNSNIVINYSSSRPDVVKVDNKGILTALKSGSSRITVSSGNKKVSFNVKVVGAKIKFNVNSIKMNKGDTKELVATVTANKIEKINWSSSSYNVASIVLFGKEDNKYRVKLVGKKSGSGSVIFEINGEKATVNFTVVEPDTSKTIACPNITYNAYDNYIDVIVEPAAGFDNWKYYVSGNLKTGKNAKWIESGTYKGKQTLHSKYADSQGKIRVYDSNNNYRDCFTAPFDYDNSKNTNSEISEFYTTCPSYSEKLDKISNNFYVKVDDYSYGVKKVYFNYSTKNTNYQYSWLSNKGVYRNLNNEKKEKLQLYKTQYNIDLNANLTTTNDYDRYGIILVMNKNGDVSECVTGSYGSPNITKKTKVGNTNVLYEDSKTCVGSDKTVDYLKIIYNNAPYLFKNNMIRVNGTGAVTYGYLSQSYVNLPCNNPNTYVTSIHEMAHVWDRFTKVNYGSRISDSSTMKQLMSKYNDDSNLTGSSNFKCSYSWFYDKNSSGEFFVGIYTHYYLDKYYGNKSSSEIDKLAIHDCWKWLIKNKKINSDVKNFIEDSLKKYK